MLGEEMLLLARYAQHGGMLLSSSLRSGMRWCLGVKAAPSFQSTGLLRLYGVITKRANVGSGCRGIHVLYMSIPGGLAAYHLLKPSCVTAYCKQRQQSVSLQRLTTPLYHHSDTQQPFNWSLFLKFILPDALLLLVAVSVSIMSISYISHTRSLSPSLPQSAVVAAILNISIPLELGQLINSVAQLEPGRAVWQYLKELSPSAIKLLSLYTIQVSQSPITLSCI